MGNAYLSKGYSYQDSLTTTIILQYLIQNDYSEFWFDKTIDNDFFDDFKVINNDLNLHIQIKYSDSDAEVTNKDFSYEKKLSVYNIAESVNKLKLRFTGASNFFVLALKRKNNEINDILDKVDIDIFNCIKSLNYYKFKKNFLYEKLKDIYTNNVIDSIFENVYLSFGYPDFTQQTFSPGDLDSILISLAKRLGVGEFPNKDKTPEYFIDNMISYVRSIRTDTSKNEKSKIRTSDEIIKYTRLITDFGSLEQRFKIDDSIYIERNTDIEMVIRQIETNQKSILVGVPGSGKSYLMNGIVNNLENKKQKYLKHYCYLGYDEETSNLRVQKENFVGNILDGLLSMYPKLKQLKKTTYGATIENLNAVIDGLSEKTYLIIDGVDHAYRSYKNDERTSLFDRYDLIDAISKIKANANIHILLITQDVNEIDVLAKLGYFRIQIPDLSKENSVKIINRISIQLTGHEIVDNLQQYIVKRAGGNALILTYLAKYVVLNQIISEEDFAQIPDYNGNVEDYYEQLKITGSSLDILCYMAVSECPLTLDELSGISGKLLKTECENIRPYLTENNFTGGYYFFHESFKRFLLEKKIANQYNLEKYRDDVINFLLKQDIFEYEKRYLFLFRLMFLNARYKEIYQGFDFDYLVKSKMFGYSNNQIRNNVNFVKMSSMLEKDYYILSVSLQVLKIVDIDFGQEIIEKHPIEYYSILHKTNLNKTFMQRYLVDISDLNAYLNSIRALESDFEYNWNEMYELHYGKANDTNKIYLNIKTNNFNKNTKLDWVINESDALEVFILIWEYLGDDTNHFIKNQNYSNFMLLSLINNAINYNYKIELGFEDKLDVFKFQDYSMSLLKYVSVSDKSQLIEDSNNKLNSLSSDWFYLQFLRFAKKISVIEFSFDNYEEIDELYDTFLNVHRPFINNPRVPDIHDQMGIYSYLILLPLSKVKIEQKFTSILKFLIKLSERVFASTRGVEFNPIAFTKWIKWIPQLFDIDQSKWIISLLYEKAKSNLGYVVYDQSVDEMISLAYIASCFDKDLALHYFEKAVRLSFFYGFHKDRTLSDILDSYPSCFSGNGDIEHIRKMHFMAHELQYVTNRKDTGNYPVEWVESIAKVNLDLILNYISFRYKTINDTGYTDQMYKALYEEGYFDNVNDSLFLSLINRESCIESGLFIDKMVKKILSVNKGDFRNNLIKMLSCVELKRLQEYKNFELLKSILGELDFIVEPSQKDEIPVIKESKTSFNLIIKSKDDIDKYFKEPSWSRNTLEDVEINNALLILDKQMKQYFLLKCYMHQTDGWGRVFVREKLLLRAYEIDKDNFDRAFHDLFVETFLNNEYIMISIPYLIKSFNVIPHYKDFAIQMWLGAYDIISQRIPEFKENNDVNDFFIKIKKTKNPIQNLSKTMEEIFGNYFYFKT